MDYSPALFVGQTKTRLVRGRRKFKVPNKWPPSCEDPILERSSQEMFPKELTDLEEMYKEFCKKAYDYIATHPTMQGEYHPHQIIFPDFTYEVIPDKFPIE